MSDIKGKYKKILEDLENNIKEPQDLIYSKEKIMELTFIFMDIVDRLTALMDARIKEVEDRQMAINNRLEEVQSLVDEIEGDIYDEDDNYEFEIICPYCNYEFTTDIEDGEKDEIKCPKCNNIIELDWNSDEEYECIGDCEHCHSEQVAEDENIYNENIFDNNKSSNKADAKRNNSNKKKIDDEQEVIEDNRNEDEDM